MSLREFSPDETEEPVDEFVEELDVETIFQPIHAPS